MSNLENDVLIEEAQQLKDELGLKWFDEQVKYAITINDLDLLQELITSMRSALKPDFTHSGEDE
jgi:hypothetical protein